MPASGRRRPSPLGSVGAGWGAPSAAVALVSVWVVEPDGLVGAIVAAGVALAALLVFVGAMPRRQPQAEQRARRGTGGGE